jgi:hypothetical protein
MHPGYPVATSALTGEGYVKAERPQEGLGATQAAGECTGVLGQPARLRGSPPTRRRSAALPVQEPRSAMSSRTQAATGSASMASSIAALRLLS